MKTTTLLGIFLLFIATGAAANTAPAITAAAPIGITQGDPATSATIATVSDAEDSAGSLSVTATSVPSGITVSSITNSGGSINALITVSCDAAPGTNNIGLQVTDSGGLTASTTFQVSVRSTLPPPVPTISATTNGTGTSDQACPEQPLTLTAHTFGATSYQWYVDGDAISGATSQTYSATGAGSYTVSASNDCYTSAPSFAAYTVSNPTPHKPVISVLSESTTICTNPGGYGVLLESDSATGIQWYNNGFPISGANNQQLLATESGNYTVILNALGCHSAESDPVAITVNVAPEAPVITAAENGTGTSDQACPEQPLHLTAHDSNSSLTNYQWYLGNDAIAGATSNQYSATAAGDYSVIATLNGCSTRSNVYSVQNPTPHKPVITVLSDSTTICTSIYGYGVTLQADSATGIQWYNNGFAISGANNQTLLATESGNYTAILNALGCHSAESDPVAITVNTAPDIPTITAAENGTGTTDQACSEQPLVLTANDSNPTSTSYQWHVNNETIDGATSKTYSATRSGDFTVVATSPEGCSVTSAAYTVQNPTPHSAFLSARSATTFCDGGSVIIDSNSATGIQWYKDGVAIPGTQSQSYTATQTGTYTVILNALGCHSGTSNSIVVTVNPYPATPAITANGSTTFCDGGSVVLSSSSASGNQWYLDGNAISGATSQSYTASAAGSYTLVVTSNSCSTTSAATTVTVNANPSATITAPSIIDSSSTGNTASVASAGSGATYNWSITNGTITAGNGTNAITFTAGSEGTLTLSCTVTTSAGCADTKSANVSVVNAVTVTSIKPTSGSSAGGTSVTIRGTNFETGATVTFGGVAATDVVVKDSTKIMCTTPAHASGDVDVVVTNTNTASGTLTNGYKYKKN